jgi:hypothetical protein
VGVSSSATVTATVTATPTLPPPQTHVQEGGSAGEYRGSEEGWGGNVTLWGGGGAIESGGGSLRVEFDLDVRDLAKDPVRLSLAAV